MRLAGMPERGREVVFGTITNERIVPEERNAQSSDVEALRCGVDVGVRTASAEDDTCR
jgi:hypothetical protein